MPADDFIREGKPLGEWLPLMVSEDREIRKQAGEVVAAMFHGVPSARTELEDIKEWPDPAQHQAAFQHAVRQAVEKPSFPKRDFISSLSRRIIEIQLDYLRSVEVDAERFDRVLEKIAGQMKEDPSVENTDRQTRPMAKAAVSGTNCDPEALDERFQLGHYALHCVFDALDTALLEDRDSLRKMLECPGLESLAANALARIGPAASSALPALERLAAARTDVPDAEDDELLQAIRKIRGTTA